VEEERACADAVQAAALLTTARMRAERAPLIDCSIASLLMAVRLQLAEHGPWAKSFVTMSSKHRQGQCYRAKRGKGLLIADVTGVIAYAADHVHDPDVSTAERLACLIAVSGSRNCELRDPAPVLRRGTGDTFVSAHRCKGGLTNHTAPLLCRWRAFDAGVEMLRERSVS
jgi:hypothetical protein